MADVAEKLKELVDEKGPKYLSTEPYEVYKELMRSKVTDRKTAGALLMLFASGLSDLVKPDNDPAFLSKLIQKDCCLANKHLKRCSTSLIIREMQIKTTMRYHLTPVRILQKSANDKHWRECREKGTLLYCW